MIGFDRSKQTPYEPAFLFLRRMVAMIIVMKKGAPKEAIAGVEAGLKKRGFTIHESMGVNQTILGIVGDTSILDPEEFLVNPDVEKALRVQEPFKRANRMFHPDDSIIDVSGVPVGGKRFTVIAGPCSVESPEQMKRSPIP